MNQKQIRAAVEAMLFAAADPISADKLAQAVQLPQASVEAALEDLRTRYQREDSGLCLLPLAALDQSGMGRLHPPPAGCPPRGTAGARRNGNSDRHCL